MTPSELTASSRVDTVLQKQEGDVLDIAVESEEAAQEEEKCEVKTVVAEQLLMVSVGISCFC